MSEDKVESRTVVTVKDCVCEKVEDDGWYCNRNNCPCTYCWCNYGLCGFGQPPRETFIDEVDANKLKAARPSVPQQGQADENVREFFGEYFHAIPDRKYGSEEVIAFCQTYLSRLAASRSEAQPPRESNGTGTVVNNCISQVEVVVPSTMEKHLKEELRIANYHLTNAHAEIKRLKAGAPAAGSAERAQDVAKVE